jgi:hypothetical protein
VIDSVSAFMAQQHLAPLRGAAFHFQHQPQFQCLEPRMREIERDGDRARALRRKPFVAEVTIGPQRDAAWQVESLTRKPLRHRKLLVRNPAKPAEDGLLVQAQEEGTGLDTSIRQPFCQRCSVEPRQRRGVDVPHALSEDGHALEPDLCRSRDQLEPRERHRSSTRCRADPPPALPDPLDEERLRQRGRSVARFEQPFDPFVGDLSPHRAAGHRPHSLRV